ncbi:hypothetical protein BFL43_15490 [Williamsia sp. 1135]|nr:hypothetical protein BFL43_15490 [Williamsia sp. 1135]
MSDGGARSWVKRSSIRVASVPNSHVYVRHIAPLMPEETNVIRLPDPVPAGGPVDPGVWWPPRMFDPQWISAHHAEFDVFHIHFGFDDVSPEVMRDVIHELRSRGKPIVYTLHDLRNPHHREPGAHEEILDILVPEADEIITLTPGAAERIRERWARTATVLPHPHVVPPQWFHRRPTDSPQFTVGVHAKSARANCDPLTVAQALVEIAGSYDDVVIQINVHDDIFDRSSHGYDPDLGRALRTLGSHRRARLIEHRRFSDEQLWAYLQGLSVSVLPYRFGTHSGWLEACHDLGTAVLAPSCGFYGQQQECFEFDLDEDHFDAETLAAALKTAHDTPTPAPSWSQRLSQRQWLAQQHSAIYSRCLDA